MTKAINYFLVIFVGLFVASCASNNYKGPNLNASEIAIVNFESGMSLFPTKINGKDRGFGFKSKFKLAPGKNEMLVIFNRPVPFGLDTATVSLVFNVEKGQEYSVRAELSNDKKRVDIRNTGTYTPNID